MILLKADNNSNILCLLNFSLNDVANAKSFNPFQLGSSSVQQLQLSNLDNKEDGQGFEFFFLNLADLPKNVANSMHMIT
jgi:hypothetical protein